MAAPCDVCERNEAVSVAASPLGPTSVAYCRACLEARAEPVWLVERTIAGIGWPESAEDWFLDTAIWRDDHYIQVRDAYDGSDWTRLSREHDDAQGRYE